MIVDPKQLARDMAMTAFKLRLSAEKALLERMLKSGCIDQDAYNKERAACNENFVSAIETYDKMENTK